MVRKVLVLLVSVFAGAAFPGNVSAEPEQPCRQCTSFWDGVTYHKHTATTCIYLNVNCWSCANSSCHWGTYVVGTCDSHGHEPCGVEESLASVRQALDEADGMQLVQVASGTDDNIRLDTASGYVLVMDCNGAVAAAYRVPPTALLASALSGSFKV